MKNNRRKFIKTSLLASAGIPLISQTFWSFKKNEAKSLSILILGGTSFLGPHQIKYALERGHKVSIFTRGKTKPNVNTKVFENVEHLVGDRENNLSALKNRSWDIVIDNSGRKAIWTKHTAQLLKKTCKTYIYTSSTGVYFPYRKANFKEHDNVLLKIPENIEDEMLQMEYDYGVMKAKSEHEAIKAFGEENTVIVRPTYMFGPGDKTDRFIHWPIRLARKGEILVPGKKNDPVQYIDVRDVAEFMIRLAEKKIVGIFNAVGPRSKESISNFITNVKNTFDVTNEFIYIDDYDFLKKNKIYYIIPWIMQDKYNFGSARINNSLAIENGLEFRDLKTSILETHEWWYSDNLSDEKRNLYEKNPNSILVREKEIITNWKKYKNI